MKAMTALLAVVVLGLAACGSGDDNSSSSSASSGGGGGGGYGSGKASTSNSTTKSVEMYDNYFGPKTVTGKPGATVTVQLKNVGQREHNFKIDGQKADADVEPGKSATVSVTIPKSGSVQFYCEYHKGLGMTGTVKGAT